MLLSYVAEEMNIGFPKPFILQMDNFDGSNLSSKIENFKSLCIAKFATG